MFKLLTTILMLPFCWAIAKESRHFTSTVNTHAIYHTSTDTNKVISNSSSEETDQKIFSVISDRQIQISGYTQFRFQEFQQGAGKVNGADLRRIRTTVNGRVSNEWQYLLQVDFASSPKALDAFVRYSPYSFINLTVGQFKIPFSLENLCSSSKLEMIDRSQVVEALVARSADVIGNQNGRDIGVQISGSAFNYDGHFFLDYTLGLFNGAGINTTDNNNAKDLCGRLVIHPLKGIDLGTDYYNGYDIWGNLGKAQDRTRFGLEVNFAFQPIDVSMEYISGKDGSVKRNGWYIQMSYFVISKVLQAAIKYDKYDPNIDVSGNNLTNYTLGINYFINNWIKLQAIYLFRREEINEKKNDVVEIQLQFGF